MTRRWRRRDLAALAGGAALGWPSRRARGAAAGRVVVIGGGAGGATVARYLALSARVSGAGALQVTLVEPKPHYTTCFFSNLYLAGLRPLESLTHGYDRLAGEYGIRVVQDRAVAIDPVARSVRLGGGGSLAYDRLVVAPGIDFRDGAIAGYDAAAAEAMPHAWTAGPQTVLLRRQLEAMEDGGVFVLVAPPEPFRCPPGPYERASLVASYFQRHKPRAKILILDAKDSFFEQDLFEEAWRRHYPGMIEWLPAQFTGGVTAVDVARRAVVTPGETFRAAVANVIPAQMAGRVARDAGLADASGWCPVDPATFESTRRPGIHLVGDAINPGAMPKSAFAANSQAKVCAFAIAAALLGAPPPVPHLFNTCYTFLAPDDAVSDAIAFRLAAHRIGIAAIRISSVEATAATRAGSVREADDWYTAFTRDMFG